MKKFLIYDKNAQQAVARVMAESAAHICNPYSGVQYERIEIPQEIEMEDAGVDENLAVVEDQDRKAVRLLRERNAKLDGLRSLREPKLKRCDQLVNIAYLNSWTSTEKTELKNYRLALLDITEPYKADMSLLDSLDLAAIEWPTEPTEV